MPYPLSSVYRDCAMSASLLVRTARRRAGLTQAQLAGRMTTSQSVVARLERPDADPRFRTLDRVLRAAGFRLELISDSAPAHVDEAQLEEQLAMSPAARVAAFESLYRETAALLRDLRPVDAAT